MMMVLRPARRILLRLAAVIVGIYVVIIIMKFRWYYHMMVPVRSDQNSRFITLGYDIFAGSRRLGNQLFAYAAILGIAKQLNMEAVQADQSAIFDIFKASLVTRIPDNCAGQCEFVPCDVLTGEKSYVYEKRILEEIKHNVMKNVKLKGYFISWKYFQNAEKLLRRDLQFQDHILEQAKSVLQSNFPKLREDVQLRRVGIHIRRADIVDMSYFVKHGYRGADEKYLINAMNYFLSKSKNATTQFVVCSDDVTWAREHVIAEHVMFSVNQSAAVDLAVLSLCDDVIITTGTFGWWAGWLAGGEVVYYKHWYTPGSPLAEEIGDEEDYIPKHWLGL